MARSPGQPSKYRETPLRSLLKAVSWRVVGSLDTILLATILTSGAIVTATKIGVAEILTKTVLYFLHERAWAFAGFGKEERISTRYRKHHPFGRKSSERISRSATKTATWRVLASLDTMLLAWFFTGDIAIAAAIGGLEVFTKLVLYFLHERVWARLRIGLARENASRLPVAAHPV